MSQVLPCLTLIYVSCHFQILLNILFFYFYLFSKCARNIQKYCSNENSCVCFMGYSGYDCSQVEPTILPPPIRRTASPPDNTPPSVDKSHSTPTNTYIRKSTISVSHQKISHTEKNGTCKFTFSYLIYYSMARNCFQNLWENGYTEVDGLFQEKSRDVQLKCRHDIHM